MEFDEMLSDLTEKLKEQKLLSATISQPRMKSDELKRVRMKPLMLKGVYHIQFEYQYERILNHENVSLGQIEGLLSELLNRFRQVHAEFEDEKAQIQISKKFKVLWKAEKAVEIKKADLSHNRKKQYLLDEHSTYPFLVRLGVQTPDGKVKKQKYDKFRQINRFVEFIDDSLQYLPKDRPVRILDFGSGKSYLTFALYHYLHEEKGLDIRVTGLDLKKEVIEECRQIAEDLDYENLEFLVGDISDYNDENSVDMVVTLHACDVATDLALGRAVKWGAKVILSVPCCQHELFTQLASEELNLMTKHGLIKERFASLATDSIRAELLSIVGYDAQLLEFIDVEHTPKNIMIRAYYTGRTPSDQQKEEYRNFVNMLNAKPFLEKELAGLI
ncbi:class I SAM-dependent methyltransferase [Chungangia koreensis]|uniref:Class I SAM-dependent methyltransferase n=1 Tax=Chungangia koreensis TaxID=752657 RepID=A0ABV8X783_9LACT